MSKEELKKTPEYKEMVIKLAKWIEEYGVQEQIEKICTVYENKKFFINQ